MNERLQGLLGLTVIALLISVCLVAAQMLYTIYIDSGGNIEVVGLRAEWLNGTTVSYLDWGTIPNNTLSFLPELIRLTNDGNVPVNLTLTSDSWSANITALSVAWNYTQGTLVDPGDSLDLQLSVVAVVVNGTSSFSHRTIITGEAQ